MAERVSRAICIASIITVSTLVVPSICRASAWAGLRSGTERTSSFLLERGILPAARARSPRGISECRPRRSASATSRTPGTNGNLIIVRDSLNCLGNGSTTPFPETSSRSSAGVWQWQKILNVYPQRTLAGSSQFNYTSAISTLYPRRGYSACRPQHFDRTRLTALHQQQGRPAPAYGNFASTLNFPLSPISFPRPGKNGVITLTHTFSPTLTNEFIFGPSKNTIPTYVTADDQVTRARQGITTPLLYPSVNFADYIPNFKYGVAGVTFR